MDVTNSLRKGDTSRFEKLMTALLSSVTYRFQRKQDPMECERYFQYTFYLIVKMLAFYSTVAEKETSEGRIDCVVECPDYVYIIEFKLNGSAEAALKQIEEKGYAKPYASDSRKLIAIGINFSSEKGTIDGFIPKELWEKLDFVYINSEICDIFLISLEYMKNLYYICNKLIIEKGL